MSKKHIHREIKRFIKEFKNGFDKDVLEEVFAQGNCYHFAIILDSLYEGEIYYDQVVGHFMFRVDGNFYDITGHIPNNKILNKTKWERFKIDEPKISKHIIENCAYKRWER